MVAAWRLHLTYALALQRCPNECLEEAETPCSTASSPTTHDISSTGSTINGQDVAELSAYCWSQPSLNRARRSSLLPACALFGNTRCIEFPGTRLQPIRGWTKAKQKALEEHISFWANHYAEVDAFELIQDSPQPGQRPNCTISPAACDKDDVHKGKDISGTFASTSYCPGSSCEVILYSHASNAHPHAAQVLPSAKQSHQAASCFVSCSIP